MAKWSRHYFTFEHPRWSQAGAHFGFDAFGFSALPGGLRSIGGHFNNIGTQGHWWSSTEQQHWAAYSHSMNYNSGIVYHYPDNKANGFSLRCFRELD